MTETDRTLTQHGAEAADLLASPAFDRAFTTLRDQINRQWRSTSVKDTAEQQALLQLAKAADKFESLLRAAVQAGEAAQERIRLDEVRNEPRGRAVLRKVGL